MTRFFYSLLCLVGVALMASLTMASCSDGGDDTPAVRFGVLKTEVTMAAGGGTQTLGVTTPVALQLDADQPWLTASATAPSPTTGASVVTLTAEPNPTAAERTAVLTVRAGSESAAVTVWQAGVDVTFAVAARTAEFAAEGGAVQVAVTSAVQPAAQSDAEWLTVAVTEPDAAFGSTLTLTAGPNPTYERRTATVTVTAGADVATVAVAQAGARKELADFPKAMTLAAQMYPGWNLGNTMEPPTSGLGAETSWQPTKTSQQVLDYVASLGFRSVRIPCAWNAHADAAGTIDAEWMARVKEVVGYALSAGLIVLLNDHWDGGWIETAGFTDLSEANQAAKAERLATLWTQVAEAFADHDERLIFAGLNEPNAGDNAAQVAALVRYEQAFVDAVRATGGYNTVRCLVVQGPNTDIDKTDQLYKTLPADPTGDGYLMAEVHYYSPWNFCGMEKDESWGAMSWFWGAGNHVAGSPRNSTWGEEAYLQAQLAKMKKQFADRGVPVILGEYGCQWRKLAEHQAEHDASVRLFHKLVNQYGPQNGCIPMVWDINHLNQEGEKGVMAIVDRTGLRIFCEPAMQGITEGVAATSWPY